MAPTPAKTPVKTKTGASAKTARTRQAPVASPEPASQDPVVDTRFLETLLGYNARRVALKAIAVFLDGMKPLGLKPVKFSVLSLIAHNPGITSRQLCAVLDIQPPNFVGLIKSLQKKGWVERRAHETDGRAHSLHLTPQGQALLAQAETTVAALESQVAHRLTPSEQATLIRLLRKVYV